jgi:Cdc6-like AAA superfamily ATPase
LRKSLVGGILGRCHFFNNEDSICLGDWTSQYLDGTVKNLNEEFFIRDRGDILPLEAHQLASRDMEVLKKLARQSGSAHFLFYGEPGTGKTELARSLARWAGKKLYVVNNKENEDYQEMMRALTAACNVLDPGKSILLVDEADRFLNGSNSYMLTGEKNQKSWTHDYMDKSRIKIIWIVNQTHFVEPSTMRRFAFSQKFKKFTLDKKLRVFATCLEKHRLTGYFSAEEIQNLCSRYSINASGIADALRNLRIRRTSDKQTVLRHIETIFKNHETAILGRESRKFGEDKEFARYRLDALNPSENLDSVLDSAHNFFSRKQAGEGKSGQGLRVLLYGVPGSGKTEFVKYLGSRLKKEIVLKRASDLLSCYVGETEKLIAEAFEIAEDDKSILFLDEADSFLNPRDMAIRSWEKTQVNELLTQMENFSGLLICSTNFMKGLDPASLRRFHFKIEFRPLTTEGCFKMYDSLLKPLAGNPSLPPDQVDRLREFDNLTPGDFHAVAEKYRFQNQPPTHAELVESLDAECQIKGKTSTIGF